MPKFEVECVEHQIRRTTYHIVANDEQAANDFVGTVELIDSEFNDLTNRVVESVTELS